MSNTRYQQSPFILCFFRYLYPRASHATKDQSSSIQPKTSSTEMATSNGVYLRIQQSSYYGAFSISEEILRIKRWPVIAQQNACCIGCVLQVQIFGLKAAFLRRTPQSLVWVLHAIRVGYGGAIFAENKPNIISCDFVSNGGAMCNFNGIEVGDTASIGGAFACVF
eukprot:110907_1